MGVAALFRHDGHPERHQPDGAGNDVARNECVKGPNKRIEESQDPIPLDA